MPKANSKNLLNQIRGELGKWRGRSRVQKTSAHISYGKIKSGLHALEKLQSKEELNLIANEIGKVYITFKLYFSSNTIIINKFFTNSEQQIEYITNNSLACLEDLTNDLESLESNKPPKKKIKRSRPVQRKRRILPESDEEDIIEVTSSEGKYIT